MCRDGLIDLLVERRSDDHATTNVAKVGVAPGRDALPKTENMASMSDDRRRRGRASTYRHMITSGLLYNRRLAIWTSVREYSSKGVVHLRSKKVGRGGVSRTWTMFPPFFFHQMVQLGRPVTRMFRAVDDDRLLALFAPYVFTVFLRTHDIDRVRVVFAIHKRGALTPVESVSFLLLEWKGYSGPDNRRTCDNVFGR